MRRTTARALFPCFLAAAFLAGCRADRSQGGPEDAGPDHADGDLTGDGDLGVDGDVALDGDLVDDGDVDVDADEEPLHDWPASSRCLDELRPDERCLSALWAEAWEGDDTFFWTGDEAELGFSRVLVRHGDGTDEQLTRLESPRGWHSPWGITATPEGGLILTGAIITDLLLVGDEVLSLANDYQTFIVALDAEGQLRWVRTVIGVTAERAFPAMWSGGRIIVAGDLFSTRTFGEHVLERPDWGSDVWVAELSLEGAWRWATQTPSHDELVGDFELSSLELAPSGTEIWVHGIQQGSLVANGEVFSCDILGCTSTMVLDDDGRVIAFRPMIDQ